ncbi:hypothetical protein PHABIO_131 [Pseudomonas phage Phabio]|uniref:Uncharacterized protein n=1 Tax=Pseudomonas phage Phabio TaxID=2006668 RepID=A0A1Y0STG7_9CAUD|nr:hypothetical protein MZD05_gp131 [Pseudomonas phage Phabio]ARV76762.1 hypothetical protein PHABIO_131 [Pseudomonas phage Phabio]
MSNADGGKLAHPRVTKAYAISLIDVEKYIVDEELSIIVCFVRLKNGHRYIGDAIVANSDKFEDMRGKAVARNKVIDQIIADEMYVLRTKLYESTKKGE